MSSPVAELAAKVSAVTTRAGEEQTEATRKIKVAVERAETAEKELEIIKQDLALAEEKLSALEGKETKPASAADAAAVIWGSSWPGPGARPEAGPGARAGYRQRWRFYSKRPSSSFSISGVG